MSLILPLVGRADCIGAGLETERLARAHGWGAGEAGEAKLVVVELCSNAVRYATGGTCALDLDAVSFEVRVEDRGPGFPRWVLEGSPAPGKGGLGEGPPRAPAVEHADPREFSTRRRARRPAPSSATP